MKLGFQANNFTLHQLNETAVSLGLPSNQPFIQRRIARAYNLVETKKVSQIDDGIFRVHSQYEPDKAYIVNINHGQPSCNCPDGERTINCKHRIASLLYLQRQKPNVRVTWDDTENSYHKHGRWWVTDYKRRIKYIVYRDGDGNLICPCGRKPDCEHRKAIREYLDHNDGGNGSKITNECGSERAKVLQDKLNGQLKSQGNKGNGANLAPSLDPSNPFEEAEQYDVDQIEGRRNGDMVWKLRNGETVISYKGIMTLAQMHGIEFTSSIHSNTNTVMVKGRLNANERVSGKPINGSVTTAIELAKRNAARQLLPYAELKAVEKKAQLEAEFNWQKAKAKCFELVGEANVSILINDLTQAGKLRQDNPSHYDRTEWLVIYNACQKDTQVERDPKSLNRWSYNSVEFLERCQEAIAKVRAEKQVEANEQPLESSNGKRKLQMDKKLRTWLVEADGSKKEISCREICEQFESKQNPSIVTRLRAGIDSGADISTVELT